MRSTLSILVCMCVCIFCIAGENFWVDADYLTPNESPFPLRDSDIFFLRHLISIYVVDFYCVVGVCVSRGSQQKNSMIQFTLRVPRGGGFGGSPPNHNKILRSINFARPEARGVWGVSPQPRRYIHTIGGFGGVPPSFNSMLRAHSAPILFRALDFVDFYWLNEMTRHHIYWNRWVPRQPPTSHSILCGQIEQNPATISRVVPEKTIIMQSSRRQTSRACILSPPSFI